MWLFGGLAAARAADWPVAPLTVGTDGQSVAVADFDADGDDDVAFVSAEARIRWMEGAAGALHEVGAAPAAGGADLVALDLDGDGDPDLVSAGIHGGAIATYENLGLGVFAAQVIVSDDAGGALTVADVDGDLDPDVLVTRTGDDRVDVLVSLNGRLLPPALAAVTAAGPCRAVTGDLDGDGDEDLVVGTQDASPPDASALSWFPNGPDGFGDPLLVDELDEAVAAAVGDVDGDGDLDLVAAGQGDRPLRWYPNDGAGGFGAANVVAGLPGGTAGTVFAADLDADGDVDLVVGRVTPERYPWGYSVLLNGGDGSVFARTDLTEALSPARVVVGDLDRDGQDDLVVSESGYPTPALRWFRRVDHGWLRGELTSTLHRPEGLAIGDLDGDGDLDVASASAFDGQVVWWEAVDGGFARLAVIDDDVGSQTDVAAADVDGDGDDDLLSLQMLRDHQVGWYEALGDGAFGPRAPIGTELGDRIVPLDVDLDGDLDVVLGTVLGAKWYENLGSDGFADVVISGGGLIGDACPADLDGDGHADLLAVGDDREERLTWFPATDAGLGPERVISTRYPLADVAAADLDGDGDIDPVAAGDGGLWWFDSAGAGGFDARPIDPVGAYDVVGVVDLDGDGDADVAAAGLSTGLLVYHNDGRGGFDGGASIGPLAEPALLGAADLDRDGDGDLVSTANTDDVVWHVNPTFAPAPLDPAADDTGARVAVAGFDSAGGCSDRERCGCGSGSPEPGGLAGLGFAALAAVRRRPRRVSPARHRAADTPAGSLIRVR